MVSTPIIEIVKRAFLWAKAIGDSAEVIDGQTMLGGGSLPGSTLPTKLVSVRNRGAKSSGFASVLNKKLRKCNPPIIGRINENMLLLDPRSVLPESDSIVIAALKSCLH
jgi:L-seryl-tRNA(Ser) seleniumtransferase